MIASQVTLRHILCVHSQCDVSQFRLFCIWVFPVPVGHILVKSDMLVPANHRVICILIVLNFITSLLHIIDYLCTSVSMLQYWAWKKRSHSVQFFSTKVCINKFPDPWTWTNNCLEQWYERVFRLRGWYCRSNSRARQCEATQYNNARLNQPMQNTAAPML